MGIQAWLVYLAGLVAFGAFCAAVLLGVVGAQAGVNRFRALLEGTAEGLRSNRSLVLGSVAGMLGLNGFFAVFPIGNDLASGGASGSEQGRVLMALGLYLLCVVAWYLSLWRATLAVRRFLSIRPDA